VSYFETWSSGPLRQSLRIGRWGTVGRPLVLFSTGGGQAHDVEAFGLIGALQPLLAAGRIKVYSCDDVPGRAWIRGDDRRHCAWLETQFHRFLVEELVPAIHWDCRGLQPILLAGASLGAFHAIGALCRSPEIFRAAIAMSGTFDLSPFLEGHWTDDFYYASPLHYLPGLAGWRLDQLRQRFVVLAYGGGRCEHPEFSWRMADALGAKGVPNRVDPWGPEWDHDWATWQRMLPVYLEELL